MRMRSSNWKAVWAWGNSKEAKGNVTGDQLGREEKRMAWNAKGEPQGISLGVGAGLAKDQQLFQFLVNNSWMLTAC